MPTIQELLEQALEPNNWVFHKNLNARYDQKQKKKTSMVDYCK